MSHKPVTAAIVYAATGDLTASAVAMVGSILPDLAEYSFMGLIKHRGLTHLWPLYVIPAAILLFLGHYFLAMFFLGAFLHLVEDGLSISGVRIWPFKKRFAMKLYRTYRISEYITAVAIIIVCVVLIKYLGYMDKYYLYQEVANLKNTVGSLHLSTSWRGILHLLRRVG